MIIASLFTSMPVGVRVIVHPTKLQLCFAPSEETGRSAPVSSSICSQRGPCWTMESLVVDPFVTPRG